MSTFSDLLSLSISQLNGVSFTPMRLHAVEGMSMPFAYELVVTSSTLDIEPKNILGLSATIQLTLGDGSFRYFNGLVGEFYRGPVDSQAADDGSQNTLRVYTLKVVPWTWLTTQKVNTRIFERMSVKEIIDEIFGDYSQADYSGSSTLTLGDDQRIFTAQYEESDWDYDFTQWRDCSYGL